MKAKDIIAKTLRMYEVKSFSELLPEAIDLFNLEGVHPAANLFPFMSTEEFEGLIDDANKQGFVSPVIVTGERVLLDGRNRLIASLCLEKDVRLEELDLADPVNYVLATNMHRRHLTTGQRALIGVGVEKLFAIEAKKRQRKSGGDKKSIEYKKSVPANLPEPIQNKSNKESRKRAAELVGTSARSISKAKVINNQAPDLASQVKTGTMTLNKAESEMKDRKKSAPKLPSATGDYEGFSEYEIDLAERVLAGETVVAAMYQTVNPFGTPFLKWVQKRNLGVKIGRPSDWQNPFKLGDDGNIDDVMESFADFYFPRKFSLHSRLDELKGRVLLCWCKKKNKHVRGEAAIQPCHGDVLADYANGVRRLKK